MNFSIHKIYYETIYVFDIPEPPASRGEKGRDLTQSYDKSPYTNRNVKRAK